jgi:ribonuclease P protein component
MLSHKHRFHGHGGLRYLYRTGKTARTRSFMLRYTPNTTRLHSRVTVIVSKKTAKSAAKRNRIRRRIYEIVRHEWDALTHPTDISITVYSAEIQLVAHDKLVAEVKQLLSGAHLYNRE